MIRRLASVVAAAAIAFGPAGAGAVRAAASGVDDDHGWSTLEDQALSIPPPGVLSNDTHDDPELEICASAWYSPSDTLGATIAGNPDGSFTYTPPANANGEDFFDYGVSEYDAEADPCPEGGDDKGRVFIEVTPVNDPPEIADLADCSSGTVNVLEDSGAYDEACVAFDSAGPLETEQTWQEWVVFAEGTVGLASGPTVTEAGRLQFTPAANDSGTVSLSIRARDSGGTADGGNDLSNEIEVTMNVTPVNDAPVAVADTFFALANRTLNVGAPGVLINDSDVDDTSITAVKVSNPSHGAVFLEPDGSFSYTPAAGYVGPDAFSYRASDGSATSPARVVSLTVSTVPPLNTPTPFPSAAPTLPPTPTAAPTLGDPSASPEPSASIDPGASLPATIAPSASASLAPGATPGPDPSAGEGGISLPVLLVGVLLVLLLAFGAAVYVPKWLKARQAGIPMDDG